MSCRVLYSHFFLPALYFYQIFYEVLNIYCYNEDTRKYISKEIRGAVYVWNHAGSLGIILKSGKIKYHSEGEEGPCWEKFYPLPRGQPPVWWKMYFIA